MTTSDQVDSSLYAFWRLLGEGYEPNEAQDAIMRQLLDAEFPKYGPPVPAELRRPASLSMFDQALRDIYAPGLRVALNGSMKFASILHAGPQRRRWWYKPWTWHRKNRKGIAPGVREATWSVQKPGEIKGMHAINVIYDELVPADTAFLINPAMMHFEPDPHWSWDNGVDPVELFDRKYEEWHDFGE